jgi:hypothetical protein
MYNINNIQISKHFVIAYDVIHPLVLYDKSHRVTLNLKISPQFNYFGPQLLKMVNKIDE